MKKPAEKRYEKHRADSGFPKFLFCRSFCQGEKVRHSEMIDASYPLPLRVVHIPKPTEPKSTYIYPGINRNNSIRANGCFKT